MRLYLGPDHVLQVTTMYFQQTYKRFYFADIQAVQIRKTDVSNTWSIGLTLGILFFLILAIAFGGTAGWVLAGIAGVFLAGLVANLLSGPTVVTHIQTAVQTEQLRSLNRLRHARTCLAWIRPVVEAAQAHLAAGPAFPEAAGGSAPSSPEAAPPVIESHEAGTRPMGSEP